MARIGEAGTQHALVAGDRGGAAIRRIDIGHEAEIRRGRTIGVAEREVALVHPHRDLSHLGRQVHEGIVDAPQQRHRPFHQPRHFVQQAGIVHQRDLSRAPQFGDAVADDPPAFVGIDHDAALAQLRRPVAAGCHGERTRRVEAMALGQVARRQPVPIVLAVAQVERHHRAVQQADDAPQRADPDEVAGASPAHRLGPGEAAQQRRDRAGDQRGGRYCLRRLPQHPVVALLVQLLAARAVLAQKAGHGLLRCTGARATFCCAAGGNLRRHLGRQRDAARTMEGAEVCRRQR